MDLYYKVVKASALTWLLNEVPEALGVRGKVVKASALT